MSPRSVKPDVLRPGIVGMRGSNSYGLKTMAVHEMSTYTPPSHPPYRRPGRTEVSHRISNPLRHIQATKKPMSVIFSSVCEERTAETRTVVVPLYFRCMCPPELPAL